MERINYKNRKGVFIEDAEFKALQDKILAQRQLINALSEEVGV